MLSTQTNCLQIGILRSLLTGLLYGSGCCVIKKILIGMLKPGMYVSDLNNQWVPSNNASRSGKIGSQATIDKIRQLGVTELYIDTAKGLDCPEALPADEQKQVQAQQLESMQVQSDAGTAVKRVPVTQERDRAEKRYQQARTVVNDVLNDVKNNQSIDVAAVDQTSEALLESLNTNENALACLSYIRSKDTYLLQHSVNVGILLGIFGRFLRLDPRVLKELVIGGILHDIGKVLVPDDVLHKPGKLEPEEWEEMKRHVTYGEKILDVTAGLSDLSRSICWLHHERLDGTGYPRNLPGDQIDRFGRMAAICDVYDAVTADRVYHTGMTPDMALRKLIEWSIFHLDKELVYDFIRCLSVYPVGTLVELSGNRAAVVIEANRRSPKHPIVRVFYSTANRLQVAAEVVDLARKDCRYAIVGKLDARQLDIDVTPFL